MKIVCFLLLGVHFYLILLQLFLYYWDGAEYEFVKSLLFLGVELGHALNFELEQRQRVFDILDVSKL